MLFTNVLRAVPAALLLSLAGCTPVEKRQSSLEQFITRQTEISIDGVLANIGPDGSKVRGVPGGVVIASPSRSDPDCKYIYPQFPFKGEQQSDSIARLLHLDA